MAQLIATGLCQYRSQILFGPISDPGLNVQGQSRADYFNAQRAWALQNAPMSNVPWGVQWDTFINWNTKFAQFPTQSDATPQLLTAFNGTFVQYIYVSTQQPTLKFVMLEVKSAPIGCPICIRQDHGAPTPIGCTGFNFCQGGTLLLIPEPFNANSGLFLGSEASVTASIAVNCSCAP